MIRPSSKERAFRVIVLLAGDFMIGWLSLFATAKLLPPPWRFDLDAPMVILFALSLVVALALSGFNNDRVTPRTRPSIVTALVIQAALIALGGVALARPLRRTVFLGVPLLELLAVPAWRRLLRVLAPIRPRDTILVGDARDVDEALAGLRLIGDRRIRVIGRMSGALDAAQLRDAEEVICVSPHIDARSRLGLLRIRGPRGFLMLASHADALLASRMLGWIGDQPLVEIGIGCGYGISGAVKRFIDVAGSVLLMIVSAPLSLLAALAIKLDDVLNAHTARGPVLIRQQRVGLGGETYGMWKFRSMADQRITRIGALLRPYHLDELPQLLNVFSGDMSLVGPRPERPELVAEILRDVPDFDLRCLVRPGIAGLAQVSAEYETRPEVKLRYDLMYMCDWSVWLDFRLMLRAVSTSLAGTGR
jgi:lipopolysaccharide/colanic/teichoic acid biosynthesis glycosyltransferase